MAKGTRGGKRVTGNADNKTTKDKALQAFRDYKDGKITLEQYQNNPSVIEYTDGLYKQNSRDEQKHQEFLAKREAENKAYNQKMIKVIKERTGETAVAKLPNNTTEALKYRNVYQYGQYAESYRISMQGNSVTLTRGSQTVAKGIKNINKYMDDKALLITK